MGKLIESESNPKLNYPKLPTLYQTSKIFEGIKGQINTKANINLNQSVLDLLPNSTSLMQSGIQTGFSSYNKPVKMKSRNELGPKDMDITLFKLNDNNNSKKEKSFPPR